MNIKSLRFPGQAIVKETANALLDELGGALIKAANQAVGERGAFHLALSGGSTPKAFYELLATDDRYRTQIPWTHTHLWLVDERRVPLDHEHSNYHMIEQAMLRVDRPTLNHPVECTHHPVPVDAIDPAAAYEDELRRATGTQGTGEIPRLDFVILGMGDDGHTASLFPGSSALTEPWKLVANNDVSPGTQPDVPRITMTYPLLNAAREVAVLVTGSKKAPKLHEIEQRLTQPGADPKQLRDQLPIVGIAPTDGQLTWYLDADASGNV